MSPKLTQIQVSMTSEERMHIEAAANVAGEEVHDWCLRMLVAAGHAQRNGWMPPKAAMEWGVN